MLNVEGVLVNSIRNERRSDHRILGIGVAKID
jgi:hypothetical protein